MATLWTPSQGPSGLIVIPKPEPLLVVLGGQIVPTLPPTQTREISLESRLAEAQTLRRRVRLVNLGGLVIVSNSRQKEPTKIVGHPDLASGASIQRGNTLYVSVAEAIYRESRGEEVDIRLHPTPEDNEALEDLRARARHRWENDRLPDGWTRPLPPVPVPVSSKERSIEEIPDELRTIADRIRAKSERRH